MKTQRALVNLVGRGRVLNHLADRAAKDHRAGREREILADFERPLVHRRGHPAVAPQVADEVAQAPQHAHPRGVEGAFERAGIQPERVGRRERLGHQRDGELLLLDFLPLDAFILVDEIVHRGAPREVGLHHAMVEWMLRPCGIAEAPVARFGSHRGNARHDLPELERQLDRARRDDGRLRRDMRQQSSQGAEHLRRVEADERICAEQRVERRMIFLGSQNFRLSLGCAVHFATSCSAS